MLRDLKVSEILFQVIVAKYFTGSCHNESYYRFRYLQLVKPSQVFDVNRSLRYSGG